MNYYESKIKLGWRGRDKIREVGEQKAKKKGTLKKKRRPSLMPEQERVVKYKKNQEFTGISALVKNYEY